MTGPAEYVFEGQVLSPAIEQIIIASGNRRKQLEMFETSGTKNFVNRPHIGEYAKIEFDTYFMEHGKEEIEGVETSIHYIKTGSGEPLILIHGVGQSLYTFRNNLEELGNHFTVYAIDLPAHGYSERPVMSYSVEEIALCIEALMNSLALRSAHFCAFGESAAYVLDFVQHNQGRAGNLIFISPQMSSTGAKHSPAVPDGVHHIPAAAYQAILLQGSAVYVL